MHVSECFIFDQSSFSAITCEKLDPCFSFTRDLYFFIKSFTASDPNLSCRVISGPLTENFAAQIFFDFKRPSVQYQQVKDAN